MVRRTLRPPVCRPACYVTRRLTRPLALARGADDGARLLQRTHREEIRFPQNANRLDIAINFSALSCLLLLVCPRRGEPHLDLRRSTTSWPLTHLRRPRNRLRRHISSHLAWHRKSAVKAATTPKKGPSTFRSLTIGSASAGLMGNFTRARHRCRTSSLARPARGEGLRRSCERLRWRHDAPKGNTEILGQIPQAITPTRILRPSATNKHRGVQPCAFNCRERVAHLTWRSAARSNDKSGDHHSVRDETREITVNSRKPRRSSHRILGYSMNAYIHRIPWHWRSSPGHPRPPSACARTRATSGRQRRRDSD